MGFFDRFKKDKGIELTAPMKGKCVRDVYKRQG